MSTNATERDGMSALAEASMLLQEIAGPGEPGELKKAAFARAMRKLSGQWTYNRVKDLWRQEPRARVSAEELNELRRIATVRARAAVDRDVIARLEAIEARLNQIDPDFHRETSAALRNIAGRLGQQDHR